MKTADRNRGAGSRPGGARSRGKPPPGLSIVPSPALEAKARAIRRLLDRLFPDPQIPLYHLNPYTLCISVLLSANTTDKSVNAAVPELYRLADNPHDMVELPLDRIQAIIRPIGLSATKARAVRELSRILVERYGGRLPQSLEELEDLPGVGHKTASVIMCQVHHCPAFPVDTHIHRLARRWGLSSGRSVEQTERDLKALFPRASWKKLHLQIIYYGRAYCPARNHDQDKCIICRRYGVEDAGGSGKSFRRIAGRKAGA